MKRRDRLVGLIRGALGSNDNGQVAAHNGHDTHSPIVFAGSVGAVYIAPESVRVGSKKTASWVKDAIGASNRVPLAMQNLVGPRRLRSILEALPPRSGAA